MSNKKNREILALIVALFATVALVAGVGWWAKGTFFPSGTGQLSTGNLGRGRQNKATAGADGSSGKSVLPTSASSNKRSGLQALSTGNYARAQLDFEAALREERNDPESLIYLNNAKIGDSEAYIIAVVIPASADLTGPALAILRGVAQAQNDVNKANGINGTPLKVLILNDEGRVDDAVDVASTLVADERVLGVVGHYSSGTTLAAANQYEAGQLPMISPTSTAVEISYEGDYIFRTVPSDRNAAEELVPYVLNKLNKTRAAVFYDSESTYSRSVRTEFTTEMEDGGEVVITLDVNEAEFSAGRALRSAKEANADVIMLALTEDTDDISVQILSVNNGELPVVGGDSLYDFNILDNGGASAVGLTVPVPWDIVSYAQSSFVTEANSLWGAAINWRTATSYDATKALAEAIEIGGASRDGVFEALSDSQFEAEGATDSVRFSTQGDRNRPSQLVTVVKSENGISGTGYDYEPVK